MKATILAGGRGTRARPLTNTVPKAMIPIISKPLMEFLIDLLKQHGFDQIIVSTSYLAESIEAYFRDGARFGVQMAYSFEGHLTDRHTIPEGLGSAGGLKKIQEFSGFFDDTFVVLCGDAIIDLDLTAALAFHRDRKALATIVLKDVPRAQVGSYGVVRTTPDGRIVQFQEKPSPQDAVSTTINTGIYFFEPEIFDHIPAGTAFDIGGQLCPQLAARGLPFYGVTLPFAWIDIGSTADYWRATQMILRGGFKVEMPGRELAPGIWGGINLSVDLATTDVRPPVHIGSSTAIEPGATVVGPTVIGRNCLIQAGARVDACIVDDYTRVSGFAEVHEKIVSGRFCVDRDGRNVELAATGYGFVVDDARERHRWSDDDRILMEFLASQNAPHPDASGSSHPDGPCYATLTVPSRVESIRLAAEFVVRSARNMHVPPAADSLFEVAIVEALNNALKHGNAAQRPGALIVCEVERSDRRLTVRIFDQGSGFVLPLAPQPEWSAGDTSTIPERGLGIPIIESVFPIVRTIGHPGDFGVEMALTF